MWAMSLVFPSINVGLRVCGMPWRGQTRGSVLAQQAPLMLPDGLSASCVGKKRRPPCLWKNFTPSERSVYLTSRLMPGAETLSSFARR